MTYAPFQKKPTIKQAEPSKRSNPKRRPRPRASYDWSSFAFGWQKREEQSAPSIALTPTAPCIQPKLQVSKPADKLEKEADQVAEQVMRTPDNAMASSSSALFRSNDKDEATQSSEAENASFIRKAMHRPFPASRLSYKQIL